MSAYAPVTRVLTAEDLTVRSAKIETVKGVAMDVIDVTDGPEGARVVGCTS